MKQLFFAFSILTLMFCLFYTACKNKDECLCRALENCIDGNCVLKENCYYLNNQGVEGNNLYHGVVKGGSCLDTILLNVDLSEPNPANRFVIYANLPPVGLIDIYPFPISKLSDNEYLMGSSTKICSQNGKSLSPSSIYCKVAKDSVQMKIRFEALGGLPDAGFIDSCSVTLYK